MNQVLYFSTPWCGPCKAFKPLFNEVVNKSPVSINYIDADSSRELTLKYGITSVPTIVVIDERGNEIKRHSGVMAKPQLLNFLR